MNIHAYDLASLRDKLWLWIAWHIPKRLVYWATIRLASEVSAMDGHSHIPLPTLGIMDAVGTYDTYIDPSYPQEQEPTSAG